MDFYPITSHDSSSKYSCQNTFQPSIYASSCSQAYYVATINMKYCTIPAISDHAICVVILRLLLVVCPKTLLMKINVPLPLALSKRPFSTKHRVTYYQIKFQPRPTLSFLTHLCTTDDYILSLLCYSGLPLPCDCSLHFNGFMSVPFVDLCGVGK